MSFPIGAIAWLVDLRGSPDVIEAWWMVNWLYEQYKAIWAAQSNFSSTELSEQQKAIWAKVNAHSFSRLRINISQGTAEQKDLTHAHRLTSVKQTPIKSREKPINHPL